MRNRQTCSNRTDRRIQDVPQGDVTNPNLPACSSRICRQAQGVPQGGCASRLHQKKTTTDRRRRLRGAQSGVRPNSTCAMISGICVPSFAVLHPPSGWMQHRMGPPVWCFLSYSAVCVCVPVCRKQPVWFCTDSTTGRPKRQSPRCRVYPIFLHFLP